MLSKETENLLRESALRCYCTAYVPYLRGLEYDKVRLIAKECQDVSDEQPLYMMHKEVFTIKAYDPEKKLTGLQLMALMASCLWILCKENEEAAGAMLDTFPWFRDVIAVVKRGN